jgi:hypothetical protein
MKRKRHTPEEIIKKLRTAEEALVGSKNVPHDCGEHSDATSVGKASIPASRRTPSSGLKNLKRRTPASNDWSPTWLSTWLY